MANSETIQEHQCFKFGNPYEVLGISQASSQETIDERYKELTQQFRKLTAERKDKKVGDFNIQTEAYEYLTSSVKDRTGKTQRMHYDALFPPNYKQTVRGRPKKSLTASPVYEDKITERFEEEKANKQLKRLPFLKSEPLDEEQPKKQRKKLPSVKLEPGAAIPKDSNVIDLVSHPGKNVVFGNNVVFLFTTI
jgi:DnaJ-class molecular chaperone